FGVRPFAVALAWSRPLSNPKNCRTRRIGADSVFVDRSSSMSIDRRRRRGGQWPAQQNARPQRLTSYLADQHTKMAASGTANKKQEGVRQPQRSGSTQKTFVGRRRGRISHHRELARAGTCATDHNAARGGRSISSALSQIIGEFRGRYARWKPRYYKG